MMVGIGATFGVVLALLVLIVGIIRLVWLYAFAEKIIIDDDPAYSSFGYRTLWRTSIMLGWEKDDDDDIRKPYGADVRGTGIDMLIALLGNITLFAIWPITLIVLIGYFPLQTMHEYHAKRKTFVANLKGEHLET